MSKNFEESPIKFPSITRSANLATRVTQSYFSSQRGNGTWETLAAFLKGCVPRNRDNVTAGLSKEQNIKGSAMVARFLCLCPCLCLGFLELENSAASYVTWHDVSKEESEGERVVRGRAHWRRLISEGANSVWPGPLDRQIPTNFHSRVPLIRKPALRFATWDWLSSPRCVMESPAIAGRENIDLLTSLALV